MRPDDDKDQKEREFWIAVYNVPMVHRHGLLVTSPSCTAVSAHARTHARTHTHHRTRELTLLHLLAIGFDSCEQTRSVRSSPSAGR
jgi:hypothetical protein